MPPTYHLLREPKNNHWCSHQSHQTKQTIFISGLPNSSNWDMWSSQRSASPGDFSAPDFQDTKISRFLMATTTTRTLKKHLKKLHKQWLLKQKLYSEWNKLTCFLPASSRLYLTQLGLLRLPASKSNPRRLMAIRTASWVWKGWTEWEQFEESTHQAIHHCQWLQCMSPKCSMLTHQRVLNRLGGSQPKKKHRKKKNSWGEPGDITQTIQWYTKP